MLIPEGKGPFPTAVLIQGAGDSDRSNQWARSIAENFPQIQDSWVWAWWEKIGAYDPITYWKLLKQPALILFGEEDEFDNVPVKESIVRLEKSFKEIKKDITIRVYPGSGHGLFEPGTETRRLREEAFQLLTSWVLKRTIRQ